jgi:hypothetical protein
MVCKLVFVLKSIQDYHLRVEHAFNSMDAATRYRIEAQYTILTEREIDESLCSPPAPSRGGQSGRASLQDAGHSSGHGQLLVGNDDVQVESQLSTVITNWVQFYVDDYVGQVNIGPTLELWPQLYGHEFRFRSDLGGSLSSWLSGQFFRHPDFESYKMMKVFILQHAMSLGSRGTASRDGWRFAAANSMTLFNVDRFIVCEAIMLSLFLRRQNAIRQLDNISATVALNNLNPDRLWPYSSSVNLVNQPRRDLLREIYQPGTYPGPFRFPSSLSLDRIVSKNFKIFVDEIVSYVIHVQNRPLIRTGMTCADWIKGWIGFIWAEVKTKLVASPLYNGNVGRLLESQTWESTWWREEPEESRRVRGGAVRNHPPRRHPPSGPPSRGTRG